MIEAIYFFLIMFSFFFIVLVVARIISFIFKIPWSSEEKDIEDDNNFD
jgi:hypothetical protein